MVELGSVTMTKGKWKWKRKKHRQMNRETNIERQAWEYLHKSEEKVKNRSKKWDKWKTLPKCRPLLIIFILVILAVSIGVIIAYFTGAFSKADASILTPPNPTKSLPPSASKIRMFKRAAVCVDSVACSKIGNDILAKNGSAVDAAIAAQFCNGIVNMHSMGLGGGFLMTIYTRETNSAVTLNAREMAPLKATPDMFKNQNESQYSARAVGVPGELRGYWTAHQRFGKLPWKEIVEPSIELCESGYNITFAQHLVLNKIRNDSNLREWFYEPDVIAGSDGNELYNGSLSKLFLKDIAEMGGIISQEDLNNYKAEWMEPVTVQLNNGERVYSIKPPGSGLILAFILNILDGYNFTSSSLSSTENSILTYHRIIEAFKFAYARRTELGDLSFVDIKQLIEDLTSKDYANKIKTKIDDNTTHNNASYYGGVFYNAEDHGTAHISVLAPNGDAVSVTSTVNIYFGLGVTSKSTGIILNNGLDDFSFPNFVNYYGVPGSPNNALAPGKRPLSSMTPSIVTDRDGNVKYVIGASGGTKITTAIALVIMRNLWFKQNIKEAVDAPRIHHQLYPMHISYEYGNLQQIITGLEHKGHNTSRYSDAGSIVCAISVENGTIIANADYRKGGDVYGLD
ncbi:hypothetical protein FQR65_LT03894 [Abscondita terminalis]|nr:hypothetical protein FQR65_LT03894 [Abscondita terminalis]